MVLDHQVDQHPRDDGSDEAYLGRTGGQGRSEAG